MDICTRGLEIQSHLITHFNLLSLLLSPLSPSSIIMCTDLNENCYWLLYPAHVTKNQSNDWLLQLSGKWTGKEIPTGNRVPEHQGGGVTNGDFRVSHYNYKCSASSTFATHYSKSRQNKKKQQQQQKNTIVLPLLQNLTNNRNRPMLFEIVDQYTESGAHYWHKI